MHLSSMQFNKSPTHKLCRQRDYVYKQLRHTLIEYQLSKQNYMHSAKTHISQRKQYNCVN